MDYSTAKTTWANRSPSYDEDGNVQYSVSELAALDILMEAKSRVAELKEKLANTDYKDLPNYQPKDGEDISAVITERNQWREELRTLLAQEAS